LAIGSGMAAASPWDRSSLAVTISQFVSSTSLRIRHAIVEVGHLQLEL